MDYIVELAVTFWQWSIVAALVLIGLGINIADRVFHKNVLKVRECEFSYDELPHMQPIRIPTKDKGFFGAIWLWIMCVRNWTIMKDFYFTLNGEKYVIPAGFQFDGASVPKFLATFLSPVGVLLIGGLVHDYGYKYKTLLKADKKTTIGNKDQRWMDRTFRDINIQVNGFHLLNYLAYWALRIGGFVAWNGHRKRNAKIEGVQ
jgi:hypothetical protein